MKTLGITVIIISILAAFACNNQQSKKAEDNKSAVRKQTSEKPAGKKADNTEQEQVKPCEDIVTEILTTSPRYRQLSKGLNTAVIKNGGQSFGIRMERSPNPGKDNMSYSKTYDFTLYEMYPERQLNTARFSFNPTDEQLYEYDAVHDQLKPIEFNRNLLLKYDALCK